nr:MAG TPA: hypothetical protein [Caudoviricetes sp.]
MSELLTKVGGIRLFLFTFFTPFLFTDKVT